MKNISGVTLIEMLIGVVISSIIIAAMYTTYSVINNTYSRVTDVAGISKSGRDIVSMIIEEITTPINISIKVTPEIFFIIYPFQLMDHRPPHPYWFDI